MGRIRTQLTKRNSAKLIAAHENQFKNDFTENKKLVSKFAEVRSKKLRNVIAGYITRLMNQQQKI